MITFKAVSVDNFDEIIDLHKKPEQKGFVMGNLYSMAQSKVIPSLIPMGIYSDDVPVGFVLYERREAPDAHIFLKRYMIDGRYQGRGLGRAGLAAFIELMRADNPGLPIELMHYPDNIVAAALYDGMGFRPTGEVRETETVKRLLV